MRKRFFGILLSLFIVINNLTPFVVKGADFSSDYYTDTEEDHAKVKLSDMEVSYDYDEGMALVKSFREAVGTPDNADEVERLYYESYDFCNRLITASILWQLESYENVNDKKLSDRANQAESDWNDIGDIFYNAISDGLENEYEVFFIGVLGENADSFRDLEDMTDEEKKLSKEMTKLQDEYYRLADKEEYTLYWYGWYKKVCKNYADIVKTAKEQARVNGYDSYRQYAYEEIYFRDYTEEEVDAYREYVKKYAVPLYLKLEEMLYSEDSDFSLFNEKAISEEEQYALVDKHLDDISPELRVAYDYFRDYELESIDDGKNRANIGFTQIIPYYNVPFIYNQLGNDGRDLTTLIHEFGHFNNIFHSNVNLVSADSCMDVKEIHSQGLELLFLKYANDCYGEKFAKTAITYILYDKISSVVEGCLFDEFQQRIFEAEKLDTDTITDIFVDVCEDYGMGEDLFYWWAYISHNFDSPFYYISYSTSAIAALEIFAEALENRPEAIDTYLRLSAVKDEVLFKEALEEAEMSDVFEKETVEEICAIIKELIESDDIADKVLTAGDVPEADSNSNDEEAVNADEDLGVVEETEEAQIEEPETVEDNTEDTDEIESEDEENSVDEKTEGLVYPLVGVFGGIVIAAAVVAIVVPNMKKQKNNN